MSYNSQAQPAQDMPESEFLRLLRNAHFTIGVQHLRQLPIDEGFEVAFTGRSNVGKSSAINAITGRKSLARTSKIPGRTQQLNFFELDEDRRIVDLPGYGFAKAPVQARRHWERLVYEYLSNRQSLVGIMSLMDIRHPLTDLDTMMVNWSAEQGIALHIILTKADKLRRGPAMNTLQRVRSVLKQSGVNTSIQLFSSLKLNGVIEARVKLAQWLV
jgi:GTP-binding protein